MIQLNGSGRLIVEPGELARLQATFAEQKLVTLPGLIGPSMLDRVWNYLESAEFFFVKYADEKRILGEETRISADHPAIQLMTMLLNNSQLFRVVQEITNCPTIRSYLGRIRREQPNSGHHLSWHNDPDPDRLIAITINLSPEPYSGGLFQMREKATLQPLADLANTGFGDALIFQVRPDYEHRTTPVVGTVARTTCAGWFHSSPGPLALMLKTQQTVSDP